MIKFKNCPVDPHYKETPKVFDEENIQNYQYPLGEMVRELINS